MIITSPIPAGQPTKPAARTDVAIETIVATEPPVATDLHVTVPRRFMREGRWKELAHLRDQMMREALARHMPKADARAWVYAELDRLYPPLPPLPTPKAPNSTDGDVDDGAGVSLVAGGDAGSPATDPPTDDSASRARGATGGTERVAPIHQSARLQGLSEIPESWGDLPGNTSLGSEIAWVQANRLRVVEERGTSTIVRLERATTPAPSWAALAWLETAITNRAKFVDVAAKVAATSTEETEQSRRERMAIDEIRELLDEMHTD